MLSKRLMLFSCATVTAVLLWPSEAAAQRRPVYRSRPRTTVAVGVGFGYARPYYPFYSPFYPYYGSLAFGWAPYYGYPYYGGYQVYGYPYGYYRSPWASLRLEMKPRNAQVFVDGYFVGDVDQFDGVFQRLDIPAGEHEVAVYLPGYRTYREKNLFRPGEGYHYKAILEPLAAGAPAEDAPKPSANAPEPYPDPRRTRPMPDRPGDRRAPESQDFGTLNVRVQPGDATVIIDGERWDSPEGGSRLSVQLSGGTHRIEVRKDGFRTYTSTVQIRAGETESLNISLPQG